MDIFEQLEVVFSERRSEVFNKNKKYKKYIQEEAESFTRLQSSLNSEQQKLLEQYLAANTATYALVESLSYKQGMIDLLDFLKSIGFEGNEEAAKQSIWLRQHEREDWGDWVEWFEGNEIDLGDKLEVRD